MKSDTPRRTVRTEAFDDERGSLWNDVDTTDNDPQNENDGERNGKIYEFGHNFLLIIGRLDRQMCTADSGDFNQCFFGNDRAVFTFRTPYFSVDADGAGTGEI